MLRYHHRLSRLQDALRGHGLVCLVLAGLALLHACRFPHSEPIFGGDESRHVMTGVFFRDLICDAPVDNLQGYAERYYAQYPALGLLVWPPLFHFLEGAWMLAAGTSATVGRILVAAFALLASVSLYRLVGLTHDRRWAAGAVALFGASPMIFTYSHFAMLEIPTLAWSLTAILYFVRYLETLRGRDVLVAAVCSAFAALTRYDAAFLLPLFLLILGLRRQWAVCRRKEVLASAALALLLVVPCYAVCFRELAALHVRQATESVMPHDSQRLAVHHLWFYPTRIPEQVGWFVAVAAVAGLAGLWRPRSRRQDLVYYAIVAATYLTFTPLAELGARHTIYWVPALAVLALRGVQAVRALPRTGGLRRALAALLLAGTLGTALRSPEPWVRGYEAAARHVVAGSRNEICLFDGWNDGTFVHAIRHLDPRRRHWVLRGDKVLYNFICVPGTELREYARNSDEILALLDQYAPDTIVVEDPPILQSVAVAQQLRDVLDRHPQQFSLEAVFPVIGSRGLQTSLKVYRNRRPDARPRPEIVLEMLMRGKTIRVTPPPGK